MVQTGCGNKEKKTSSPVSRTSVTRFPSQEGWNSSITLTRAEKLQAVIRYGHMAQYEDAGMAYFDQGVSVDFYDTDGKHTSRLTSDRGEYHEGSEDVAGEGHVVVVSDTGIVLKTERLMWNNRTEKIITDDRVMVTDRQGDTVYGLGFESNSDLSHWVIKQPRGLAKKGVNLDAIESSLIKRDTLSRDTLDRR